MTATVSDALLLLLVGSFSEPLTCVANTRFPAAAGCIETVIVADAPLDSDPRSQVRLATVEQLPVEVDTLVNAPFEGRKPASVTLVAAALPLFVTVATKVMGALVVIPLEVKETPRSAETPERSLIRFERKL